MFQPDNSRNLSEGEFRQFEHRQSIFQVHNLSVSTEHRQSIFQVHNLSVLRLIRSRLFEALETRELV